ncbi:ABC transporter substrate-binding protein [Nitrosomonas sp.]|uniref:ABC transporter substrate-binding protein n=1 Tax=Nitrosomonas sp. TaxID=42353 RepID=UPI00207E70AD|nr:ABC transporter substrate-binding protein [Nitrosomonas sp.]GJL76712.1 MAG: ABC transporter substrate-binding protein [Nitrosomonas sp.]
MRWRKIITYGVIPILTLFCLTSSITVLAEKVQQVLIVANTNDMPYQETIEGFKAQLMSQLNVSYNELFLSQTENQSSAIRDQKPDLIFALGSASTQLAKISTSDVPIVSTMTMKNDFFEQGDNITGVSLVYPLTTQFQWIKKFFPTKTKIAILYNPKENEKIVEAAGKIAQQFGLELYSIPVESPRHLPLALEQLAKNIEVLLAIPDEIAMSSKTVKAVLLATFRNKVPFVGLSDSWVKSGALYALSWDYHDLGQQCANQSAKLLKGVAIQQIPMEYPKEVAYTVNEKIAEHMNIRIPDDLRQKAKMIFN